MPDGQLVGLPIRAGSTSSCNLYASVNFGDEFLRSAGIFHFYADSPQVSVKLRGGLEMNAREAEAAGGFDVSEDIVDVDGFFGADFAGPEGFAVDERIRLAGADGAGVGANGFRKMGEEIVGGFEFFHMDGISVGEEAEAIAF